MGGGQWLPVDYHGKYSGREFPPPNDNVKTALMFLADFSLGQLRERKGESDTRPWGNSLLRLQRHRIVSSFLTKLKPL
ncbi:hypothetical protein K0M31_009155 [Melipona bicolor]|uniref:Uncharacterized protein n=1 Tax=Melipona bicolor TaxID=60889 RepID=A0AA40KJT7_9HYME|nr:hypothetical protein K0M31_009155 [Melipona bicolor]